MRKHYSEEYKKYVVKLVTEDGRKMTALSYELDIPYGTITKWLKGQRENKVTEPETLITPKELKKREEAYEKKIRSLKEENEILKKAMHIFTKDPM
jgi:transposase